MARTRTFDHADAVRDFCSGTRMADVARKYGVTIQTMHKIIWSHVYGPPHNRRKPWDRQEARRRYEAGESIASIARWAGVGHETMRHYLASCGAHQKSAYMPGPDGFLPRDQFAKLASMMPPATLARLIGVNTTSVTARAKRMGLEVRS